MKKYISVFLLIIITICGVVGFLFLRQKPHKSFPLPESDYNPNYANAIQQKKPELCQDINYALLSGPTDSIDKYYGSEAVDICESQAKAGFFGCECDSDTVLNNMRKR